MSMYDIIIIGASFAGLSLAHHLPQKYKILILDKKKDFAAHVETTGLITEATHSLLASFCDVDSFIPNKITDIAVVSPNFNKYFISSTNKPWVFSTDTPNLLANLAQTVPDNVEIKINSYVDNYTINKGEDFPVSVNYYNNGDQQQVKGKFLVGADGHSSIVAKLNPNLSQHTRYLAGLEKVFYGKINLGNNPDQTVFHFWFGEFSLGYGGWISPFIYNGKPAFRVGLAKLEKDIKDLNRLNKFIKILQEKNIIQIQQGTEEIQQFGNLIPISGVLKNIYDEHSILLGDAAGFCGAFAADGIKGAVLSGKICAKLIPEYFSGNKQAFEKYKPEIQKYQKLITYYRKQEFYRLIWDQMKKDRTFHAMYDLIATAQDDFLDQFCDSKDNAKSLTQIILHWRNFPLLLKYGTLILIDMITPNRKEQ